MKNFKMSYFILTLLALFLTIHCEPQFYFPLIATYFKEHNIKLGIFFTCWNKNETITLKQILSDIDVRFSFMKSQKNMNFALLEKKVTRYGFVLDHSCRQFTNLLSSTTNNKYKFKMSRPWLIFTNYHFSMCQLHTIFEKVNLRMDSNVKLVLPEGKRMNFFLLDIYNPGFQLGEKPIITEAGSWNGNTFEMNTNSTFYLQRKNMSSMILRTGSVVLVNNHLGTFEEYMLDPRSKQYDTMSKFHYSMFLLLEDVHNFSYVFTGSNNVRIFCTNRYHFRHTVHIEDKWFGNYQNGSDGGIAKYLYEEKIDITCTGASQRPPRVDVYDYLMPSYHFRPCYIFRNPGSYDIFSNEFLKPFSRSVWYIIIFSSSVVCIFLKILYSIENRFINSRAKYSWATVILITLATIFQQGSSICPNGYATRLIFISLQLTSIVLFTYYTSSIISSLLNQPPQSFQTLYELGHSKLEIGIENLPYTITWFEIMNDSDVQYIYRHKVFPQDAKHLNIYEAEEGIAKLAKGGFAYHTQLDTAYPLIAKTFDQEAICDLHKIPMIPQVFAGIMAQKMSQYKELFHVTLRMIKQAGLVHRFSLIWESKEPLCLSSARVFAVGLDQTFIAFIILITGMAFSLLFLVIEIIWFKFNLDGLKITKS